MKKERYFRDELRRMFIGYAIIPAAIFTLACGIVFMAALLHGKRKGNLEHSQYVAAELDRVVSGYEQVLADFSVRPELFQGVTEGRERVTVFERFYRTANDLGYEAEFYLLDQDRTVLFPSDGHLPAGLAADVDAQWGILGMMEREPQETAIRLVQPWVAQSRMLAMGKAAVEGGEIVGYALILIPGSCLNPVLEGTDAQTIVTDPFGWALLANNQQFLTAGSQVIPELEYAGESLSWNRHTWLVSSREACGGLFRVYAVSDIQNIVASLTMGAALVLTALVLMAFWMLLNTRKVTEKKTEDFYRILEVMEEAAGGNLEKTIQIDRDNEFATIADTYNQMIASLKTQMENNRKMAELVASSQNKQLESQFNPHFLYNTLENIRYMCKMEPEIAEKMVYSLSGLLRYSLDGSAAEVTLKEDLEHLENYLTILRYRFNRRFSYQIDVEPEAYDCRIPKLVLQPMIENSVKYGFGNQATLKVELKAYLHEGKLIMICRDDGIGITPSVLSEVTELLGQPENKSRHSGIYNIHRRIGLLYGRPYGVEVRSAEGHGTTLVVTLPEKREESYAESFDCGR